MASASTVNGLIAAAMMVWLVVTMDAATAQVNCGNSVLLAPCLTAARNAEVKPPPSCCSTVAQLLKKSPRCLCSVLSSPLAKQANINTKAAVSIPKRCGIKNRPKGKKCQGQTVP